jgi:hypothetical protein
VVISIVGLWQQKVEQTFRQAACGIGLSTAIRVTHPGILCGWFVERCVGRRSGMEGGAADHGLGSPRFSDIYCSLLVVGTVQWLCVAGSHCYLTQLEGDREGS